MEVRFLLHSSRPGTSWWLHVAVVICLGFICITGSLECPKECRECGSNGHCEKCNAGFFGADCKECSPRCKYRLCVPGKCNDGCVDGSYGSYCDKNCTHCPKGCDIKGRCLREEELEPEAKSDTEHHIFIGFMCFAVLGVLAIIVVFIAEKKYPYTRCRLISIVPKTKKPHEASENMPSGEIIWRYAQDLDSAQGTSNLPTRTQTCSGDVRVVPEVEQVPLMHTHSDVRILVLPPTPTRSGDHRTDVPVSSHSLFPLKGKNKRKNRVYEPT